MDEQKKYEVIKNLAEHPNPNKERAALTLGCTIRHINRMLEGYREQGKGIRKELEDKKKAAKTQKEVDSIQTNLVAVEDAHSRRPRATYFGELEQLDAYPL